MQYNKQMLISQCINLSGSIAIATRILVYVTTGERNNPCVAEKIIIYHPTALSVFPYYLDLYKNNYRNIHCIHYQLSRNNIICCSILRLKER